MTQYGNYDAIGITYRDTLNNVNYAYQNVFVPSANNKDIQLQIVANQGNDIRLNTRQVFISGTSISTDDYGIIYAKTHDYFSSNEIAITRVDGYTY